jgi:hypothetical protein
LPSLGIHHLSSVNFSFDQTGFREEDFFKSTKQKEELPMSAMLANGLGRNEQSL